MSLSPVSDATGIRLHPQSSETRSVHNQTPSGKESWWQHARILRESASEHRSILAGFARADEIITASLAEIDRASSGKSSLVADVFGVAQGSSEHARITRRLRRHFRGIQHLAHVAPVVVSRMDTESVLAFVRGNYPIVFITRYGLEQSVDFLGEVLVHEFSHAANATNDYAYEWQSEFSDLKPWQRSVNADHVRVFAHRAFAAPSEPAKRSQEKGPQP